MDPNEIKELYHKQLCNALEDINLLVKKHSKYLTEDDLCCCLIDFSILTLKDKYSDDNVCEILGNRLKEMTKLKNLEFTEKVNSILKMETNDPTISDH